MKVNMQVVDKSLQIGFLVRKDAQWSETYEKNNCAILIFLAIFHWLV